MAQFGFAPVDGDYIEVTPAYGRDYKSKAAILEDLFANKDFVLTTTQQYLNMNQMWDHKFRVIVRYGKNMKTADVTKDIAKYYRTARE